MQSHTIPRLETTAHAVLYPLVPNVFYLGQISLRDRDETETKFASTPERDNSILPMCLGAWRIDVSGPLNAVQGTGVPILQSHRVKGGHLAFQTSTHRFTTPIIGATFSSHRIVKCAST